MRYACTAPLRPGRLGLPIQVEGFQAALYYEDPDQNLVELNVNHYGIGRGQPVVLQLLIKSRLIASDMRRPIERDVDARGLTPG